MLQGGKVSIIKLVENIIEQAGSCRASDIHIDPQNQNLRVRFRVDGVMQEFHAIPKNFHQEIISRVKILAGMRTDEHQAAQDGRFRMLLLDGHSVDVRVSITPTYHGENAVLRLLSDKAEDFSLQALGFSPGNCEKIQAAIKKPYGMILATGPTGTGKTTTLYTLLKELNTPEVSIVTIEDPIEYAMDGIEQIQVNPRTSLTFANGLRSILRQDPNIIMVGEIRDNETAGLAVNTALTGHLVLSTLHTSDAATTLPRLLDMKIESYLIASTVNAAIGQRLLRKVCPACKEQFKITAAQAKSLIKIFPLIKIEDNFYKGVGCETCGQSGYSGRIGAHEVLTPGPEIREAVLRKKPAGDIRKLAISLGMVTMLEDALTKAQSGLTTLEEVLRMHYE